jgi:hypothetical protein
MKRNIACCCHVVLIKSMLQCFDLRNFLVSNVHVSGSRWRCASCEKFLLFQDLQFCGFTADLLTEFKDSATPQRDRVELHADRSYRLQEGNKRRTGSKRQASDTVGGGGGPSKKSQKDNEIIIL